MHPERDPLPEKFASPEETADFWDRHEKTRSAA